MKRTCAICGKNKRGSESTYGFRTALKLLGHPNWEHDKAHASCIKQLQTKQLERTKDENR